MVAITFAKTPEEMRRDMIKLAVWYRDNAMREGENPKLSQRAAAVFKATGHRLSALIGDMERLVIEADNPLPGRAANTDVVLPVINLNGGSPERMVEDICHAMDPLRDSLEKLAVITPHGRDYQTAPEGLLAKAQAQHTARVVAVRKVLEELETLALGIQEQRRR